LDDGPLWASARKYGFSIVSFGAYKQKDKVMNKQDQRIKGLNEVVIRARDLNAMEHFYVTVVGLELMQRFPQMAFLKIGDGYAGLTQLLALFDATLPGDVEGLHYAGLDSGQTTLHYFSLGIAWTDYETEKQRLEQLGLKVQTMEHGWTGWRSIYIQDPEGNVVELVCSNIEQY
jgi:catechol 2,3-dioxygenase-like lactoylglutathione lyase family enzyme